MIDTRKYEGHTPAPWRGQVDTDGKTEFDEYGSVWKGKDVIALVDDQACDEMFPDADLNLITDAPLLLAEVKRLREEVKMLWQYVDAELMYTDGLLTVEGELIE